MKALTIAMLGSALIVAGCGDSTPHAGTPLTTSEEFDAKVVKAPRPVLVDFYADWCPPCKKLMPVLVQLEAEYAGKVDFYRVDTDVAAALSRKFNVSSIPTLMLYRNGKMTQRMSGYKSPDVLRRHLDALLAAE